MGWPNSPQAVAASLGRGAVCPPALSLASDLCFTLSLGDTICFMAAVKCALIVAEPTAVADNGGSHVVLGWSWLRGLR